MDSGLKGSALSVTLALWSFADDAGRCWPSVAKLARRSGMTGRGVRKAIGQIEAAGVLARSDEAVGGRSLRVFRLDLDALPEWRNHVPVKRNDVPGTRNHVQGERRSGQAEPRSGQAERRSGEAEPRSPMEPTIEPTSETISETISDLDQIEPVSKPDPLWSQMGLPKPGRGVTLSHLTAPVLDVWAHWWNACHNTKRPGVTKPRAIGKGPVRAIKAALGHGYTVEELQTVTRYAFDAPDGSPHVDWWRSKPHFLSPATIMGKELDRNQTAAALWASGDMPTPTPPEGGQIAYLQSMLRRNNGKPRLNHQGHHAATGGQPQEGTANAGAHGGNGTALGDAPW